MRQTSFGHDLSYTRAPSEGMSYLRFPLHHLLGWALLASSSAHKAILECTAASWEWSRAC